MYTLSAFASDLADPNVLSRRSSRAGVGVIIELLVQRPEVFILAAEGSDVKFELVSATLYVPVAQMTNQVALRLEAELSKKACTLSYIRHTITRETFEFYYNNFSFPNYFNAHIHPLRRTFNRQRFRNV